MRQPFYVRPLRPADLDRILEVEHESFGKDAYDRKLFAKYLAVRGVLFLVGASGPHICGYSLAVASNGRAELVSIAVAPRHRRKGIARSLIESTLRRLQRRGVNRVSLTVKIGNDSARALYEEYGFVKTRTVRAYYEDGADGMRMVREWRAPADRKDNR
jgi:ribosomal-protein-alanine N-acetyltransferase